MERIFKFELGDKLKDLVTDFEGQVIGRTNWLTGCNTYGLKSKFMKDGAPIDAVWGDEIKLVKIDEGIKIKKPKNDPGGPQIIPKKNIKGF